MNQTQSQVFTLTSAGATEVSVNKDSFRVTLSPPIRVPGGARNCYVKVLQATIWNSSPNIVSGVNNLLRIRAVNTDPWTDILIPTGQYTVSDLNSAITRELFNAGLSATLITITGDAATQKVQITFELATVEIEFTVTLTLREILGFNATIVVGSPTVQLAPNIAQFNTINAFRIHSDIIDAGINVNGTQDDTVIFVPILASPGSQIVYSPFSPTPLSAQKLIGDQLSSVFVRVTDEINEAVILLEDFSLLLEINYQY